jgi:hypothetical protein
MAIDHFTVYTVYKVFYVYYFKAGQIIIFAAEGSTPNLDMKVSPAFTRPSLSRRSMYCRGRDLVFVQMS